MPYPHAIRLRGPWQFEPLYRYVSSAEGSAAATRHNLPPGGRATAPGDWGATLGRDFHGRVRYRRAFHAPATLDRHERLWLVVEGVDARGVAAVNGIRLGEIEGYAIERCFDITQLIARNNQVTLEVDLPPAAVEQPPRPGRENLPGGLVREVRLEVRSQWFIENLAIWNTAADGSFVAQGRIAGEASPTRLAVVISGCQRELAYFEAAPGEGFEMEFTAEDFPAWSRACPRRAALEVKLLGHSLAVWQRHFETAVRTPSAHEAARLVREILTEKDYQAFDDAGVAIVQEVPPAWAGRVCPRLAHHPSIVAWTAPGAPAGSLCGRPWLSPETSFLLQPD